MTRTVGFVCCAFLLAFPPMLASTGQKPAPESAPVTRTATIEAIDKANRTVTLKEPAGSSVEIEAPEQMEGFNSLRAGDSGTATYFAAIAVNLRKPGTRAPCGTDDDDAAERPHAWIRDQEGADGHGTVEAIDAKAPSLTVKGPQGRVVRLPVRDATQLQNVKVGDTVDVTYYESLLIKVAHPPD